MNDEELEKLKKSLDEFFRMKRAEAYEYFGRPMRAILYTNEGFKKEMALWDFTPVISVPASMPFSMRARVGNTEDLLKNPNGIHPELRFQFEGFKDRKLIYKQLN